MYKYCVLSLIQKVYDVAINSPKYFPANFSEFPVTRILKKQSKKGKGG